MRIANLDEIKRALAGLDLLPAIEAGFVAYSQGRANVPPVGELLMDKGEEVHIKYGWIEGDPYSSLRWRRASSPTPPSGRRRGTADAIQAGSSAWRWQRTRCSVSPSRRASDC